jgi:hypothetical protein
MLFGVLAATIVGIEEHHFRRIGAGKKPVVAHIGPKPVRVLPLASTGAVVSSAWMLGGKDMAADCLEQRHQRRGCRAHPVGQRRHVEINAFPHKRRFGS